MSARLTVIAAAAAGALATAGCSQRDAGDQPAGVTKATADGTVASSLAGSADHRKLATALTDTQLAPVLDGKGDYTLLAPSDAAFDALGDKAAQLTTPEQRPLMIAILRGHILPGSVTPKAIQAAIDRKRGPVEMRTMAGNTVTFARAGDAITVANGAQTAKIAGPAVAASNGAVLPIDKVLLPTS